MDIKDSAYGEEWAPIFVIRPLRKFGEIRPRVVMVLTGPRPGLWYSVVVATGVKALSCGARWWV